MMPEFPNIGPLVPDDGTNSLKKTHECECGKTFRSLYNFAVHSAMKHDDWSVMKEWAEKTGRKIKWGL